ncbi:hypothetical protein MP228_001761 [Amoeboaphelidium protococcarum]|nr:hypothetical protein MP228_001761 [Amoeboaphelidium protococcarum]
MADSNDRTVDNKRVVILKSNDGQLFELERDVAMGSGTLRGMLESSQDDSNESSEPVLLPSLNGAILAKVIDYLRYKAQYSNSKSQIPEFDIDPAIALDLLMAADYLDC